MDIIIVAVWLQTLKALLVSPNGAKALDTLSDVFKFSSNYSLLITQDFFSSSFLFFWVLTPHVSTFSFPFFFSKQFHLSYSSNFL